MRDALGFPIDTQHLSEALYQRYSEQSEGVREYAEQEWKTLLPDPDASLPPRSRPVKWLIRHGIPMQLRRKCWYTYSGAKDLCEQESGLYTMLTFREAQDIRLGYTNDSNEILEFVGIIQGDLYRTFPNHPQFTSASISPINDDNEPLSRPPMIQSLRRILVAFAYYSWPHPEKSRRPSRVCTYAIGYCQGLNVIVALLLLVYTHDLSIDSVEEWLCVEEQVFWTLVALVENLLPSQVYGKSLKGAQVQQQIFWLWIIKEHGESFGLKDVSEWMVRMVQSGDSLASLQSITTPWFMNLFINVLPMDSVLRVLDCFFYQGEKTLYRVALSLLQLHQKSIFGFDNVGDACTFIKTMPKKMINAHLILQHCFIHINSSTLFVEDEIDHWTPLNTPKTFIQRDSMEKIDHLHASRLNNGVISDCRTFLSRYASTRSLDSNV